MKDSTLDPPEVTPYPSAPHAPSPQTPPSKRSSRVRWIWLAVLVAIAIAGYYTWPQISGAIGGANSAAPGGGGGKGAGGRGGRGPVATPVVAVKATRGSIGEYVTGLGNVTPVYTVAVKTRVDGELMTIHYKEGDIVQKGAPLLEIDPRPFQVQLDQFEGAQVRDQALLDNAKVDVTRYEGLLKQNAIPEQQYATQKALVAQYEGIVKTDQGQIDGAKLNLTYCHIVAPITGRVGLRLVDPGNIVHATDSMGLLVIAQIQPISVIFPMAEDQLPQVLPRFRAGQKLPVDAWDRDQTHKVATGTLVTVDNQIDQTTGTVRLRADFPNTDDALFPNQFVYARLLVQQKQGVTLLATAAIQRTTTSTYVWLVKPDSTVTARNITLGTSEGDQSQVLSGLEPGDVVVMTGVDKLNEGGRVNAQIQGQGGTGQPAAAGAPAGKKGGKKQ
jgi:multidrug efflux system membrane fusion protein